MWVIKCESGFWSEGGVTHVREAAKFAERDEAVAKSRALNTATGEPHLVQHYECQVIDQAMSMRREVTRRRREQSSAPFAYVPFEAVFERKPDRGEEHDFNFGQPEITVTHLVMKGTSVVGYLYLGEDGFPFPIDNDDTDEFHSNYTLKSRTPASPRPDWRRHGF